MKKCPKCKAEYTDEYKFCTNCGNKLAAVENKRERKVSENVDANTKSRSKLLRRFFSSLLLILFILGVGWHYYENVATRLIPSETELVIPVKGLDKEMCIGIDCDGYKWEIEYKPYWLKVYQSRQSNLCVWSSKNTTHKDREDHITLSSGRIKTVIKVRQYGNATYLKVSEQQLTIDKEEDYVYVGIDTDGDIQDIKCKYPNYCSPTFEENSIKINFDENKGQGRKGNILLSIDDLSERINFFQKGDFSNTKSYYDGEYEVLECGYCHGVGEHQNVQCYLCKGKGVYDDFSQWGKGWNIPKKICEKCHGKGVFFCPVNKILRRKMYD